MSQEPSTAKGSIRLRCMQSGPAPPEIIAGWKRFRELPPAARANIWQLLAPVLLQPAGPAQAARAEQFSAEHEVSVDDLALSVQSCAFVISRASALDLGVEDFQQDLVALSGGSTELSEVLVGRYEAIKGDCRKAIIHKSLADHGKVLVGLDWRVDNLKASSHGANLETVVILLTLRYQDGEKLDQLTLQLTPSSFETLKTFMERFGS